MSYKAMLKYVEPESSRDRIQLIIEGTETSSVIIFNQRKQILNLLQQLRLSLARDNKGALVVSVRKCEYHLGNEQWRALLYVLEHWFDGIIDEEWDSFAATLDDKEFNKK